MRNIQISQGQRMAITVPHALVRLDFLKSPREVVAILRDFEARFARKQSDSWSLHLPEKPVRILTANGQFAYSWNDIPIQGIVNGELHILPDKVLVNNLELFAFATKTVTTGVYDRGSGHYQYTTTISGLSADTLTTLLREDLPDLKELQLGAVMDGNLRIERTSAGIQVSGSLLTPRAFLRRLEWTDLRSDITYAQGTLKFSNGSGSILGGKAVGISGELAFARKQEIPATTSSALLPVESQPGVSPPSVRSETTYTVSGTLKAIPARDLLRLLGIAERAEISGNVAGSFSLSGVLGDSVRSNGKGLFSIENAEVHIPGEDHPVFLATAQAEWTFGGNIFRVTRLIIVGGNEDFYIAGQALIDRAGHNTAGTGVIIVRDADTLKSLPDEIRRFFRLMQAPIPSQKVRKMAIVRLRGHPRYPIVFYTPGPTTVIELAGDTPQERLDSVWRHYQDSRLSLF